MDLYAPRNGNRQLISTLPSKTNLITPPLLMPGIPGFEIWRATCSASTANSRHIDIYHGLSNELPADIKRFHGKKVVTIHDLIFLKLPETYSQSMRRILEKKTRFACEVADKIVTVSDRTRIDLIELYGIPSERIEVIYQSIDPIFFRHDDISTDPHSIIHNPYILCVGTIEQRKNQNILVEALPQLSPSVHLVIIGKPTAYFEKLQATAARLGVESRLHLLTDIPTSDLPAWYRNAAVTCNPSFYEGFGIPVAESIAQGTPIIAATGSCLEEAGGPGGLYVSPDSPEDWAGAIDSIMNDKSLRDKLSAEGLIYANNFKDSTMGHRLIQLYDSLL